MNITTSIIATIPDQTERNFLFTALHARYAMWEASFIINGGDIYANPAWWSEHNLIKDEVWIEIHAYCKGWLDARRPASPK